VLSPAVAAEVPRPRIYGYRPAIRDSTSRAARTRTGPAVPYPNWSSHNHGHRPWVTKADAPTFGLKLNRTVATDWEG